MQPDREDKAPPGYRYVTSPMPGGGSVRYLEEIPIQIDRSIPMATPEGRFVPTPPSIDQMKYELSQRKTPADLGKFLLNLPTEMRNQAMAIGEMGAGLVGGVTSQLAGAATGVGRNIYDLVTQGRVDPKATRAAASKAAELLSYQPTLPSAQSATETLGNTLGQLPPIVSGINPMALTAPRGTLGSIKAGLTRDIDQFSNDVYNAQRGIRPGYPTLGSEFSDAFVTPKPTVYEMLSGLEPSNVPSTASAAVKPVGKGTTLYDLYEPFPSTANPSGMTGNLSSTYKKTYENAMTNKYKASDALDKYADEVRRVNPEFDQRVYQRLEEYVVERVGVVPDHEKPYQLQLVEQVNNFANDWNAANPNSKIPTFDQFLAANTAYNQWLLGPNKNYIERQMGTGVTTDPVLAEIEKTGLNLFPDSNNLEQARDRRERARQIHAADTGVPLGNIGQETAKTEAGIKYENLADTFIMPRTRTDVYDELGIPAETRPQFDAMRPNEPIYDVHGFAINPVRPLQEKLYKSLLTGEIKPENVSNVSMQRLVTMLYKDEQERLKAFGKDKDAYAKYKKTFFDRAPAEMVDKTTESGAKFIRFNKDSPLSPSDLVRTMCIDTKDLNHCLASGGHSIGDYKGYAPVVEPHTGKPPRGVKADATTGYIDGVKKGSKEIVSYRGSDGSTIATIEEDPYPDGKVQIVQIMSNNDQAIKDPAHAKEVRQWMNDNADRIESYSSSSVLGHVGNPIDLYKNGALDKITKRDSSINRAALEDLMYDAQMEAALALDEEFSQWYEGVTGRNFADDFFEEPVSNIVESSAFGSDDLARLEEILGENVSTPEYRRFMTRATNLDNNTKGAAQSIGRFVTIDEIKQYAKNQGISLKFPDIDIATAPRKDLVLYSKRLEDELDAMINDNADREDMKHVERRLAQVVARVEELNSEMLSANKNTVEGILKDLPELRDVRDRLVPVPVAYAELLNSTLELTGMRPFAETGPLLEQLEILRGPVEGHILNVDQREALRRGLLRDARADMLANLIRNIKESKNDFNIIHGQSTPEQNAQAAQIVANWLNYRLNNTDMRLFGAREPMNDNIRAELGLEAPAPDAQPALPNMNRERAAALNAIVDEFLNTRVLEDIPADMEGAVNALVGNQVPAAILPQAAHRHMVALLVHPNTTIADIRNLYTETMMQGPGLFQGLDEYQRANARAIIEDWSLINGIDIIDLDRNMAQGGQVRRMADGGSVRKLQAGGVQFADDMDQMRYELSAPFDMKNRATVLPIKHRADSDWRKSVMATPEEKGWDLAVPGLIASPINAYARGVQNPNAEDAMEVAAAALGAGVASRSVPTRKALPEYYHGSDVKGLSVLDPAASAKRRSQGSSIWVTPDETFAAGYPKKQTGSIYSAPLDTSKFAKVDANFTSNKAIHPDSMIYHSDGKVTPVSALGKSVTTDMLAAYARSKGDPGLRILNVGDMGSGQYRGIGPNPSEYGESVAVFKPLKVSGERKVSEVAKKYKSVKNKADGGAVTDTLDKMVKNPQASTLLNLDLPNLIAAKQQAKTLKYGGRVKFANNIDAMRLALSKG